LLALYDGSCQEIDCADESGQESILWQGDATDELVIVVDGKTATGNYALNIEKIECESGATALTGNLPIQLTGQDFVGAENFHADACFGTEGVERIYTFKAPADGTYTFEATTVNSAANPIGLVLRDGVDCEGKIRACREWVNFGPESQANRWLAQDEEVTVVVESLGTPGGFSLEVRSTSCPVVGTTGGHPTMIATLPGGGPVGYGTCSGNPKSAEGVLYEVTASNGLYTVDGYAADGTPFALSVWLGEACGGELYPGSQCSLSSGSGAQSTFVDLGMVSAGTRFFVLVEPVTPGTPPTALGDVEINASLAVP